MKARWIVTRPEYHGDWTWYLMRRIKTDYKWTMTKEHAKRYSKITALRHASKTGGIVEMVSGEETT